MSGRSVVITGATGMVGGAALRLALSHAEVQSVTTVGRRPTGVEHVKLREVVHEDFSDCASVADALAGHDAALFCLGVYTGSVPDDEFRRITVDYTIGFARAVRDASPAASFSLLSGQGADPTEASRISFARYKGMAENALLAIGFERLHVFRPGYIYPVASRTEPNVPYRIMRALWPALRLVYPNLGISSEELAAAMLWAGLSGTSTHDSPILENRDIRALTATLS